MAKSVRLDGKDVEADQTKLRHSAESETVAVLAGKKNAGTTGV